MSVGGSCMSEELQQCQCKAVLVANEKLWHRALQFLITANAGQIGYRSSTIPQGRFLLESCWITNMITFSENNPSLTWIGICHGALVHIHEQHGFVIRTLANCIVDPLEIQLCLDWK